MGETIFEMLIRHGEFGDIFTGTELTGVSRPLFVLGVVLLPADQAAHCAVLHDCVMGALPGRAGTGVHASDVSPRGAAMGPVAGGRSSREFVNTGERPS